MGIEFRLVCCFPELDRSILLPFAGRDRGDLRVPAGGGTRGRRTRCAAGYRLERLRASGVVLDFLACVSIVSGLRRVSLPHGQGCGDEFPVGFVWSGGRGANLW